MQKIQKSWPLRTTSFLRWERLRPLYVFKVQEMSGPGKVVVILWNNDCSEIWLELPPENPTQLSLPSRSQEPLSKRNLRHLTPASFRGWGRLMHNLHLGVLLDFCTLTSLGLSHSKLVSELLPWWILVENPHTKNTLSPIIWVILDGRWSTCHPSVS